MTCQDMIAALVSRLFWLHICGVGGSGGVLSILNYVSRWSYHCEMKYIWTQSLFQQLNKGLPDLNFAFLMGIIFTWLNALTTFNCVVDVKKEHRSKRELTNDEVNNFNHYQWNHISSHPCILPPKSQELVLCDIPGHWVEFVVLVAMFVYFLYRQFCFSHFLNFVVHSKLLCQVWNSSRHRFRAHF